MSLRSRYTTLDHSSKRGAIDSNEGAPFLGLGNLFSNSHEWIQSG